MPEPIITPVAQRSSSVCGTQPESSIASRAGDHREMDEAIHLLLVLDRDPLGDVEVAIGLATRAAPGPRSCTAGPSCRRTGSDVMPTSPLIRRRQTCSTPMPRGQAIPMPVTTTRRIGLRPSRAVAVSGRLTAAARCSRSRPSTVAIFSAASSGISTPNSSSNAMTSSTVSRLSAPRSSMKAGLLG